MNIVYDSWIGGREAEHLGTNFRSEMLPFMDWYRFKEAYSPEIVAKSIKSHERKVNLCLDPFSGSGTTAVTSQMLAVPSKSYEVNPFLCDLALSKTTEYDLDKLNLLCVEFMQKFRESMQSPSDEVIGWLPPTFVQPGKAGRWIFNFEVAQIITAGLAHIEKIDDLSVKRLLKVIMGSCLVPCSNVVINGKGRRYRRSWENRKVSANELFNLFEYNLARILKDIGRFSERHTTTADVQLADVRKMSDNIPDFDVSVFSPPYPNSFDYTDVYNIELWMLGYLRTKDDNRNLRQSTLSSHVQVSREFISCSGKSGTLSETLEMLETNQEKLWDRRILPMIGSYFGELNKLLFDLANAKRTQGRIWIVVGNSQYAGIEIRTGKILSELGKELGLDVVMNHSDRLMRSSPQQGGKNSLPENIIVFE